MSVLFRHYLLPAAMLALLLLLTSLWLPQGTVQSCELSWLPCLSVSSLTKEDAVIGAPHLSSPRDHINKDGTGVIEECPGQKFQVSRLLHHLDSALGPARDVLLEPYLLCWEELIKFMDALGTLVGLFTGKVQEKITLIRQLCEEDAGRSPAPDSSHLAHNPQHSICFSVRSMLEAELQRGVVNFEQATPSGSRTLLRLHRSLLWLQLLLEQVGMAQDGQKGRSLGQMCAEAYAQALAPHHPWFLQQAAGLAFAAMPDLAVLLDAVCVSTLDEARPVIHTIVMAIAEVRHRTHTELEQRSMLNLP